MLHGTYPTWMLSFQRSLKDPINNFQYSFFEDEYNLEGKIHMGYVTLITSITDNMVVVKIEDITTSKYELCTLVQLCNDLSLDPIHIYDVVDDFLS